MDRLVTAFTAARMLGFHDLEEEPPQGEKGRDTKYGRAIRAFQQAIQRGTVPPPDKKRGRKNLWRLSTIKKEVASGGGQRGAA